MSGKSIKAFGFVLAAIMALGLVVAPVSATVPSQATGGASGGIYNWYKLAPGESAEWVLHYPGKQQSGPGRIRGGSGQRH